jgi:RNA polymerase sigma-70 factor (ECF subfamily)
MKRIGRGDAHAYRCMVERHLNRITRFAARLLGNASEAEDIAQETFLRLWTHAASFIPHAQPKTWLYRVARNLCTDRLRKQQPNMNPTAQQISTDGPSSLLARKDTALRIEQALLVLPERQRAAITLVHYEGLTASEACEILELSVEALESLLARGRRSLRLQLRDLASPNDGERA